jgi:uncharacterized membrane protein
LAFATEYNWIIAALVFLMGVTLRHFFNTMHARGGMKWWTWGATAALFAAIILLSSAGPGVTDYDEEEARGFTPAEAVYAEAEGFEEVIDIVLGRCSMCHAREPGFDGIGHAPKQVLLETPQEIAFQAKRIYLHSGRSTAMPPANVSWMEPEERAAIVRWFKAAQQG